MISKPVFVAALLCTGALAAGTMRYQQARAEVARLGSRVAVLEQEAARRQAEIERLRSRPVVVAPVQPGPADGLAPNELEIYQRLGPVTASGEQARAVALTMARFVDSHMTWILTTLRGAGELRRDEYLTDGFGRVMYVRALDLMHRQQLRRFGGSRDRLRFVVTQPQNLGSEAGTLFTFWDKE